jgi:hypothetical protein
MNSILGQLAADGLTALLVEEGTSGDKTKQAARATTVIAVASAFSQALNGQASAGIAELTQVVTSNPNTDPALASAVTNLIQLLGADAGLIAQIESGTVIGSVVASQLQAGLQEVIKVAEKFGGTAPAA